MKERQRKPKKHPTAGGHTFPPHIAHRKKTANEKWKRLTGKQEDRQSIRFSKQSNIQKEQVVVVPMVREVGPHGTMCAIQSRRQEGRT